MKISSPPYETRTIASSIALEVPREAAFEPRDDHVEHPPHGTSERSGSVVAMSFV
jgi:hypothetical protein